MTTQADPMLKFIVEALDDIEGVRIAMSNRLYILTRTEADKDGEERGFGLTEDDPLVQIYSNIVDQLTGLEDQQVKLVQRQVRRGPLAAFIKESRGVGEKQAARLIAAIGDPYWHAVKDCPRTVSELWAFCGLHVTADGTAPRLTRGQRANWSGEARKRAWLVATSCVKSGGADGKYRIVYDEARAHHAEAVHAGACKPCAAQPGDPLKDGHKHARALRKVAKEVLKDMWRASRAQHTSQDLDAVA